MKSILAIMNHKKPWRGIGRVKLEMGGMSTLEHTEEMPGKHSYVLTVEIYTDEPLTCGINPTPIYKGIHKSLGIPFEIKKSRLWPRSEATE